ncbi:class C sortase [Microbacterium sp. NPDC058342]|uniref:class C sortase n=1 Tax=Microbacterium sp. NPDC058342 TaxID=3346454 RepID=UPI00365BAF42
MTIEESQTPPEAPVPSRRKWRMPWGMLAVAIVMLVGVGLLEYPIAAGWISQYHQSQLIVDVSSELQQEPSPELDDQLQSAHEYNDLLESGALLEPNANKPTSDAGGVGAFEYDSLLRATSTGVMGRLRIPAIDVDLPIYHGTSDATLAKGVGHLEGTSLPVGGRSQHSVLTAHRGLPEATLFNDLNRLEVGDRFVVEVFGEVLTYQVIDTKTVEPEDTDTLRAVAGEDLMTLVTCTPLGINTHRYLVTGERVTPTPITDLQNAGNSPEIPGFAWWALVLALSVLVALALVVGAGFARRPSGRRPVDAPTNQ